MDKDFYNFLVQIYDTDFQIDIKESISGINDAHRNMWVCLNCKFLGEQTHSDSINTKKCMVSLYDGKYLRTWEKFEEQNLDENQSIMETIEKEQLKERLSKLAIKYPTKLGYLLQNDFKPDYNGFDLNKYLEGFDLNFLDVLQNTELSPSISSTAPISRPYVPLPKNQQVQEMNINDINSEDDDGLSGYYVVGVRTPHYAVKTRNNNKNNNKNKNNNYIYNDDDDDQEKPHRKEHGPNLLPSDDDDEL